MSGASASTPGNRRFLQQSLVVAQVAISLVLLAGTGLFVRTLQELKGVDMGFSSERVALIEVRFDQQIDPPRRVAAYKRVLACLEQVAGVRTASMSAITPLTENTWGQQLEIEGYAPTAEEKVRCNGMSVASRYFRTMGTPLLSGRDFGPQDERSGSSPGAHAPAAAIINETMARRYFGNGSPLHRRFSFFGKADRIFEVVGLVKDAKYHSLREPAPPTFYVYCFQETEDWGMTFVVGTTGKAAACISGLRRAVREADPTLQLRGIRTMDAVVNDSLQLERIIASLGGCFSLTALALACFGLYGTLSFTLAQETREIGVRTALGARRADLLLLVVRKGLKLAVVGSLLGLVGALAAGRLVSPLLYGVSQNDPVTFVGVTLLLAVVAMLASWLPARRAAKVDPMVALRHE
jgi:predicted permease